LLTHPAAWSLEQNSPSGQQQQVAPHTAAVSPGQPLVVVQQFDGVLQSIAGDSSLPSEQSGSVLHTTSEQMRWPLLQVKMPVEQFCGGPPPWPVTSPGSGLPLVGGLGFAPRAVQVRLPGAFGCRCLASGSASSWKHCFYWFFPTVVPELRNTITRHDTVTAAFLMA
jgi:hypothetical protein